MAQQGTLPGRMVDLGENPGVYCWPCSDKLGLDGRGHLLHADECKDETCTACGALLLATDRALWG